MHDIQSVVELVCASCDEKPRAIIAIMMPIIMDIIASTATSITIVVVAVTIQKYVYRCCYCYSERVEH